MPLYTSRTQAGHALEEAEDSPSSCWDRGRRSHPASSRRSLSSHRGCCCRLCSAVSETQEQSRELSSFLFSDSSAFLLKINPLFLSFSGGFPLTFSFSKLICKALELFWKYLYKNTTKIWLSMTDLTQHSVSHGVRKALQDVNTIRNFSSMTGC